ncbi:hypothetical protein JTB14_015781 [Gonioctena quinquepunctata]|nr:hypothetical protein JTB14_015781 [Gonioctena quinquepunctata]
MWVPSHIGIHGNEQVDRIAQDTMNEPTAPELERVPHNDLKIHMKSVIHNYWLSKWRNSRTKLKEIRNDIKSWRNTPHQRKHQVMITPSVPDIPSRAHPVLKRPFGEEEKKCDMCQVPVSVKHFLSECSKFVKQRQDYEINTDLKVALGVNCNVLSIEGFLTEIGLLNKL